jgi:short-subunit dehydrogenase
LKNVLITGACGGIGQEIAFYFAKQGWGVIATMLHLENAVMFENCPNVKSYFIDVTSTESIESAKTAILKDFDTIDVIVNNAGIGYRSFVEFSEDDKIQLINDINWLGIVKVTRAFIPVFRQQNQGHFINITSVAGLVNLPLGSFYHATKHAVESFSECVAYELRPCNIKVSTVQFGNTPSNFQKNVVKSDYGSVKGYQFLMDKIDGILARKTKKNTNLKEKIILKIFDISGRKSLNYRKFTIGFDANLLKYLHLILGYRIFAMLIRFSVFKK